MNEKYSSERNLKSKFDSHPFSFDQEAFEKFQEKLNKKEHTKKTFRWKGPGLFLIGLFLVGIVYICIPLQNKNQELASSLSRKNDSSLKTKNTADSKKTFLDDYEKDLNNAPDQSSNENIGVGSMEKEANSLNSASLFTLNSSAETPIKKDFVERSGSLNPNLPITNYNGNIPIPQIKKNKDKATLSQNTATKVLDNIADKNIRPIKEFVVAPYSNDLVRIASLNESRISYPENAVKPYIVPFKKYFYLSLKAGMIIYDNFGTNDAYFSILKSTEYSYNGAFAYQFSPNYAVELSFSRQDFSLGFDNKEFSYLRKHGDNVSIIKAALVSNLWSPIRSVKFNMTNGLAIMKTRGASFSKGFTSTITPVFMSQAVFERHSLSSTSHVLYAGGLQLNIQLSENVELEMASEYTVGFKPWSDSKITYIPGEGGSGQNVSVEVFSKGNFYAFTLGLKYSLKGS